MAISREPESKRSRTAGHEQSDASRAEIVEKKVGIQRGKSHVWGLCPLAATPAGIADRPAPRKSRLHGSIRARRSLFQRNKVLAAPITTEVSQFRGTVQRAFRPDRVRQESAQCQELIKLSYINAGRVGLIGAPTYPMLRDATLATLFDILDANFIL